MRWLTLLLSGLMLACLNVSAQAADQLTIPAGSYAVLTFHDIRDDVVEEVDRDPYAIRTGYLARFFDWMKQNNWHPVSLQQIIDAQQGKQALPSNAVLLTFDDGAESHYTKLFPLLKNYHYPALLALVTSWMEKDRAIALKEYGYDGFLSWDQVREMQNSGLVEFASHSHDLHKGILANPQGNVEPAAITHRYNPATRQYETTQAFLARVKADLQTSMDDIAKHTGVRPRAVVWPYGAVTPQVHGVAIALAIPFSFSLEGVDAKTHRLNETGVLSRLVVTGNPRATGLWQIVNDQLHEQPEPQRALRITLDEIFSPDAAQFERRVNMLLDQVKALHINRVYITPWRMPAGHAQAVETYFPNRAFPMRQDIFNRVSWQLRTRAGVRVYADLTSMSQFDLDVQQQYNLLEDLVSSASGLSGALVHDEQHLFSKKDDGSILLQVMQRGSNISNRFAVVNELNWQAEQATALAQQLPTLARSYDELMVSIPLLQQQQKQQLKDLIDQVKRMPDGQYHVVFNTMMPVDQQQYKQLSNQFMYLINQGMISLSYQTHNNTADIMHFDQLFQGLSLNAYPYYYRAPKLKQVTP